MRGKKGRERKGREGRLREGEGEGEVQKKTQSVDFLRNVNPVISKVNTGENERERNRFLFSLPFRHFLSIPL